MEASLGEERADVDCSKENEQRPANTEQVPSDSVKPETEASEAVRAGADRIALNFDTESDRSGDDKPNAKRKSKRKQYVL